MVANESPVSVEWRKDSDRFDVRLGRFARVRLSPAELRAAILVCEAANLERHYGSASADPEEEDRWWIGNALLTA
jgi:hypothetical protein